MRSNSNKKMRLLSLDGGGVRGLSSLMILRNLMLNVDRDATGVSDYFDMIAGTSTGGIIAIMLGCLHMTIEQCITAYITLSEQIFELSVLSFDLLVKFKAFFGSSMYNSDTLKAAVLRILEDHMPKERRQGKRVEDVPFLDRTNTDKCKVLVVTTQGADGAPTLLTNYISDIPEHSDFKLWEAVLATSAAPLYFSHFAKKRIGQVSNAIFYDGGMGANNPIQHLVNQCNQLYPTRSIGYLISIGTGGSTTAPVKDNAIQLGGKILQMLGDCEAIHTLYNESGYDHHYCRLAADNLGKIGLDEYTRLSDIEQLTTTYVRRMRWIIKGTVKAMREVNSAGSVVEELGTIEREIESKLTFSGIDERYHKIKTIDGAFQWIWKPDGELRKWIDSAEGKNMFCITGKPGCGKSALMKKVHYHVKHDPNYDGMSVAGYFFHRKGEELQRSLDGMVRSLLVDLLQMNPSLYSKITEEYKRQKSREPLASWNWNRSILIDWLKMILGSPEVQPILLIIDAVDGALDRDKQEINKLLREISKIQCVKVCISSNIHPHGDEPDMALDDVNIEDIAVLVNDRMAKLQEQYEFDSDDMYTITQGIISRAENVLSFAVFLIESVENAAGDHDDISVLKQIVEETPSTLTEAIPRVFEDVLKGTKPHIKESREIFRMMYFTFYALTIAEFRDAIDTANHIRRPPIHSKADATKADRGFEGKLISRTGGLLRTSGNDRYVFVIDGIVNDLLMKNGFKRLDADTTDMEKYKAQSHNYLTGLCISYLTKVMEDGMEKEVALIEKGIPPQSESEEVFGDSHIPKDWEWKHPFLAYAASNWFIHASEAQSCGIDQTPNMNKFGDEHFNLWVRIYNLRGTRTSDRLMTGTSKFHIAVEYNLLDYVKSLDLTKIINSPGGRYGNALCAAVEMRHQEMLEHLLEKGADTEVRYRFTNETPLYLAVGSGYEGLVKALLDKGANMNVRCNQNYTPFILASIQGNTAMGSVLLNGGSPMDARADEGDTPIHFASRYGCVEYVQLLLEKQVDITCTNDKGDTPLHEACFNGQPDLVQLLLSHKADPMAVNHEGNTPLHSACHPTYEESDPDYIKDAARTWTTAAVGALLRHPNAQGIDPKAKNKAGKTPLDLVDEVIKGEIAKILKERTVIPAL